jgi:NADH-quinone oxidoreductase subunit C
MMNPRFDRIREVLAAMVSEANESHGILVAHIAAGSLLDVVGKLKDEFGFDMFSDVTTVDWLGQEPRFEVVWHFYSTVHKLRVRIKTRVPEADPSVPTLTGLYGSACFMERECHEMYGIVFTANDDLRKILLHEGFVGHPLRKDYPKEREQPLVPYRDGFELSDRG